MRVRNFEKIAPHLKTGRVYRRDCLVDYSTAIDRDLMHLVQEGVLEKVATGLYYKPRKSRFGNLPPEDVELITSFLRDDQFLIFSWNEYNVLGLGLTQLYNQTIVYNYKRHGTFKLGNKVFNFCRPARGFPRKLTLPFLIVDLLNNLEELAEDTEAIKLKVRHQLFNVNLLKQVKQYAKKYGKVKTKKFLEGKNN